MFYFKSFYSEVREIEKEHINKWIQEVHDRNAARKTLQRRCKDDIFNDLYKFVDSLLLLTTTKWVI